MTWSSEACDFKPVSQPFSSLLLPSAFFATLSYSSKSLNLSPLPFLAELCHPHDSTAALCDLNFNDFYLHAFYLSFKEATGLWHYLKLSYLCNQYDV